MMYCILFCNIICLHSLVYFFSYIKSTLFKNLWLSVNSMLLCLARSMRLLTNTNSQSILIRWRQFMTVERDVYILKSCKDATGMHEQTRSVHYNMLNQSMRWGDQTFWKFTFSYTPTWSENLLGCQFLQKNMSKTTQVDVWRWQAEFITASTIFHVASILALLKRLHFGLLKNPWSLSVFYQINCC